jgi:N-acetylglucosamine-6-phosphate deacetylase
VAALALGVRGFTHLWNAMPGPAARAPGPVVAALEQGFCGVIVDRVHVDRANLRLTLAVKPPGSVFLVSDAMSLAGSDAGEFVLQGQRIRRLEGRLVGADGTLAGADLDLRAAVRNAVDWLGLPFWQAWSMASEVPAAFLGIADRGRIAPGGSADLVIV